MSTFKSFIIAQSYISKFRFTPKSKPNLKSQKRHVTNIMSSLTNVVSSPTSIMSLYNKHNELANI